MNGLSINCGFNSPVENRSASEDATLYVSLKADFAEVFEDTPKMSFLVGFGFSAVVKSFHGSNEFAGFSEVKGESELAAVHWLLYEEIQIEYI